MLSLDSDDNTINRNINAFTDRYKYIKLKRNDEAQWRADYPSLYEYILTCRVQQHPNVKDILIKTLSAELWTGDPVYPKKSYGLRRNSSLEAVRCKLL